MVANHTRCFSWLLPICCALLLGSEAAMQAQVVTNVTGTIGSYESETRGSAVSNVSLDVQGSNFSLTSYISTDNLVRFSEDGQATIIDFAAATSDVMPLMFGAPNGFNYNSGTLIYNGVTYNNLRISLSINGGPAVVTNPVPPSYYYYSGAVSGAPFSLTGVVSAYASPPGNPATFSSPPLVSVSFSGGGLYSAKVQSDSINSGAVGSTGESTYQLLANPIGYSTDAATQGNWSGAYGGEGYLIANGPVQRPGYAAVSVSQASTYTWASGTSDARALQTAYGATTRQAAAYFGNNFNINVDFTDNNPHPVSLYLLDWDTNGRSETLTVKNATTGAVLDTETVSNFHNGEYVTWNLQGNITINVQGSGGASAVVSGIFFGPPGTLLNAPTTYPSATATFRGTNATVQGAWRSNYGSAGYAIANGPSSTPTQASLNVAGDFVYTWAGESSDARALQLNGQNAQGIASAYTQYQSAGFKIDIDASALQVLNLYLLDWDNEGRVETITITDLSTGVVLDSETASAFQGGVYYSWLISGSVVVNVTPAGSSSPVVSGIFFN